MSYPSVSIFRSVTRGGACFLRAPLLPAFAGSAPVAFPLTCPAVPLLCDVWFSAALLLLPWWLWLWAPAKVVMKNWSTVATWWRA